jgi:arginine decarboxylase
MKDKYIDLIDQTFDFPVDEFALIDKSELDHFIHIPLMDIVEQYGTPLKFTYLPKISDNIKKARTWFNVAMAKVDYKAKYHYCYCTKSSHFSHVLEEVLRNEVHLETSSGFDINLIISRCIRTRIDNKRRSL